jgi:hypothetical protein
LSRHEFSRELEGPGPGHYSPTDISLYQPPRFSLHGPSSRDEWLKESEKTPGPADYTPVSDYDKTVGVSLSGHVRGTKTKPALYVETRGDHLVAVDQLIINVAKLPDPDGAKKYLYTHPDLRSLMQELINTILYAKPENPVEFIREFFEREKNETAEEVAAREAARAAANADKLIWL